MQNEIATMAIDFATIFSEGSETELGFVEECRIEGNNERLILSFEQCPYDVIGILKDKVPGEYRPLLVFGPYDENGSAFEKYVAHAGDYLLEIQITQPTYTDEDYVCSMTIDVTPNDGILSPIRSLTELAAASDSNAIASVLRDMVLTDDSRLKALSIALADQDIRDSVKQALALAESVPA